MKVALAMAMYYLGDAPKAIVERLNRIRYRNTIDLGEPGKVLQTILSTIEKYEIIWRP